MNQYIKNLMSSVIDDDQHAVILTVKDLENYTIRAIQAAVECIETAKWSTWAEACDSSEVYAEAIKEHFGVSK